MSCCCCCTKKTGKNIPLHPQPIVIVPDVKPVDEPKIIPYIIPPMFTSGDFLKLKQSKITERIREKEKKEREERDAQKNRFKAGIEASRVICKDFMAFLSKNISANQQMEDLSRETLEGQSYNNETLFGPLVLREFATQELLQDSFELFKKEIKREDLQKVKLVKKSVNSTSYIVKYKDDYYFYKEFGYCSKNEDRIKQNFLQNFDNSRSDPAQTQQLQDSQNPFHQVDIDQKCQQYPRYFLLEKPFLGLLFRIEEYNLYTFCLQDVQLPMKCKLAADMVQFVGLQIKQTSDLSKTYIKPSSILFRRLNSTSQPSYKLLLAAWYTKPLTYTNEHSLFMSDPSSCQESSKFSPSILLGIEFNDQQKQETKEQIERNKEYYILTLSKTLLILLFFRIDLTRGSHDICSGIQGRDSLDQSIRKVSTSTLINHEEVNKIVQTFIDRQERGLIKHYSEIYRLINEASNSEQLMNVIRRYSAKLTNV